MNTIDQLQNTQPALEKLAAMRRLYSEAKRILKWRGIIALSIAVVFPFVSNAYPDAGGFFAVIALVYFAFDFLFLREAESEKKKLAAKIQEQFDVDVLGIHWNPIVAGDKPEAGDIQQYSKKIFNKEVHRLRDWYSQSVANLPLPVAQLICQRANIRWDSRLRRHFGNALLVIAIILVATIVFIISSKAVTEALVVSAPFAPLIKLLVEQYDSHRKSALCLDDIGTNLSSSLNAVLSNPSLSLEPSTARSIQDEIYRHRSSVTPVPDWFYNLFKKQYEAGMGFNTDQFIVDYTAAVTAITPPSP